MVEISKLSTQRGIVGNIGVVRGPDSSMAIDSLAQLSRAVVDGFGPGVKRMNIDKAVQEGNAAAAGITVRDDEGNVSVRMPELRDPDSDIAVAYNNRLLHHLEAKLNGDLEGTLSTAYGQMKTDTRLGKADRYVEQTSAYISEVAAALPERYRAEFETNARLKQQEFANGLALADDAQQKADLISYSNAKIQRSVLEARTVFKQTGDIGLLDAKIAIAENEAARLRNDGLMTLDEFRQQMQGLRDARNMTIMEKALEDTARVIFDGELEDPVQYKERLKEIMANGFGDITPEELGRIDAEVAQQAQVALQLRQIELDVSQTQEMRGFQERVMDIEAIPDPVERGRQTAALLQSFDKSDPLWWKKMSAANNLRVATSKRMQDEIRDEQQLQFTTGPLAAYTATGNIQHLEDAFKTFPRDIVYPEYRKAVLAQSTRVRKQSERLKEYNEEQRERQILQGVMGTPDDPIPSMSVEDTEKLLAVEVGRYTMTQGKEGISYDAAERIRDKMYSSSRKSVQERRENADLLNWEPGKDMPDYVVDPQDWVDRYTKQDQFKGLPMEQQLLGMVQITSKNGTMPSRLSNMFNSALSADLRTDEGRQNLSMIANAYDMAVQSAGMTEGILASNLKPQAHQFLTGIRELSGKDDNGQLTIDFARAEALQKSATGQGAPAPIGEEDVDHIAGALNFLQRVRDADVNENPLSRLARNARAATGSRTEQEFNLRAEDMSEKIFKDTLWGRVSQNLKNVGAMPIGSGMAEVHLPTVFGTGAGQRFLRSVQNAYPRSDGESAEAYQVRLSGKIIEESYKGNWGFTQFARPSTRAGSDGPDANGVGFVQMPLENFFGDSNKARLYAAWSLQAALLNPEFLPQELKDAGIELDQLSIGNLVDNGSVWAETTEYGFRLFADFSDAGIGVGTIPIPNLETGSMFHEIPPNGGQEHLDRLLLRDDVQEYIDQSMPIRLGSGPSRVQIGPDGTEQLVQDPNVERVLGADSKLEGEYLRLRYGSEDSFYTTYMRPLMPGLKTKIGPIDDVMQSFGPLFGARKTVYFGDAREPLE